MYIENDKIKKGYRMLFMFFCLSGMVMQYANTVVLNGNIKMLSAYYTMLTNMLCFLYFGYLIVMTPKRENPMIKGAIVMCIVLTGLGYHLLLNGAMEQGVGAVQKVTTADVFANTMVHTIVPLMTVIDYFLFSPKGGYKWWHPFAWLVIPSIYLVFIYIRAYASSEMFLGFNGKSRFPYPFLDVDMYGPGKIVLMIFVMLIMYLVLGYASYGIDKLLEYINNKRKMKDGIPID